MLSYLTRFILSMVLLYPVFINAQLYAPDADYSEQVTYDTPGSTDSIYIFNVPGYGTTINAAIEALSPDNTDGWEFLWSVYNPVAASFIPFDTVTGSAAEIDRRPPAMILQCSWGSR